MLRITLLGSGSSGGVPRVDGEWGACDPNEARNRRSRCGLLLQRWDERAGEEAGVTNVLIDTSPDLREQALRAGLRRVDAVLYTHDHADQAHGIDDLRGFALRQRRRIPVWMDAATRATLTSRFDYCFTGRGGYLAILEDSGELKPGRPMAIDGPGGAIEFLPLEQDHGQAPSLGFRFGAVAYSNDLVGMPEASFAALEGLDVWIVDVLRYTPHPTHAHLAMALEWIARLKPRRAILTNLHIDMDYRTLLAELPDGVEPAFDGLSFDIT